MSRSQFDITLSGTGGPNVTSVLVANEPNVRRGRLRTVLVRYASGNHAFTAFGLRLVSHARPLPLADLDPAGRPTLALSAFAEPDERVFFRPGTTMTPGSPSGTAAFFLETIPDEDRRLVVGPFSCSLQWTVNAGTGSVFRVSLEFSDDR